MVTVTATVWEENGEFCVAVAPATRTAGIWPRWLKALAVILSRPSGRSGSYTGLIGFNPSRLKGPKGGWAPTQRTSVSMRNLLLHHKNCRLLISTKHSAETVIRRKIVGWTSAIWCPSKTLGLVLKFLFPSGKGPRWPFAPHIAGSSGQLRQLCVASSHNQTVRWFDTVGWSTGKASAP